MRLLIPAACLAFGLGAGAAAAQTNTLTILQDGAGNVLNVDQSRASGSAVGGLTMSGPTPRTFVQIIETPTTRTITDEDGSTRVEDVVERETQAVTLDVLSATPRRSLPARQIGIGNEADVSIAGTGGFVGLLQDSGTAALGNRATVTLSGSGEALVGQIGSDNVARLDVAAGANGGAILQNGRGNTADLSVTGLGATGLISQVGTGLNNSLSVAGAGTNASLFVTGTGSAQVTGGASVVSNGATVSITQTAFGR